MYLSDVCTIPTPLAGSCAISIPCGLADEDRLPVGLQIMGAPLTEATVLRAAFALEAELEVRRLARAGGHHVTLFRRKLWGDRATWFVVLVATGAVVNQWIDARRTTAPLHPHRVGGRRRCGSIGYSELRIGRKQLRRGSDAMFLGLAAFVGEEHVEPDGDAQARVERRRRRRARVRARGHPLGAARPGRAVRRSRSAWSDAVLVAVRRRHPDHLAGVRLPAAHAVRRT